MHRREALRMFAAGAVLPALSPELFAFFRQAQPPPGYAVRTLTPHLNETVVAMIDLIIPETDTPGAKGARVNEFIDVILTDWATPEERKDFLEGLAGVDKQSNELFGKDFVSVSTAQQTALLHAMEDATPPRQEGRRHGNTVPEPDQQLKGPFWLTFRRITLHGYYTSEIGFSEELKLQIIPGAQHGCVPAGPGTGDA
jgi:hypothetical protein